MKVVSGSFFAVVTVCLVCLAGRGQESSAPAQADLPTAVALLQSGDFGAAARMLEKVAEKEPNNGRVWRNLGQARLRLKQLEPARAAFTRALAVEPQMVTPFFPLAVVSALENDRDGALGWLEKAKASGKLDMTQMEVTPELAPLRGDARYAALVPTRKDFEAPFVEPVKILHEWDGEAANDQFGWIARNIGDVDGDGVADFVTSAPTSSAGGKNAGRVYVYSTKTAKLLWKADGAAGDRLGTGIEAAGDTNADGIPDVIASAPGGGYAKVYSGRDGRLLRTYKAENAGDEFGRHVAGIGDVNGDGYGEVLVGAPGNLAGRGRAYVYSGKDGSVLLQLEGERPGDRFGSAVGGDPWSKRNLFLVGAPAAGPRRTGRVSVYERLSGIAKFTVESDATGSALGAMFVSVLGDLDGDGVPEVLASDWSNRAKGPSTGRVFVHSGKDGHLLFAITGETAGEGLGTSSSVAGDVDGDGRADVIVGSWQYSGAANGAGRAALYSGADGRLLRTYTCRTPGDSFGFDAVGLGDVDGDGQVDFLISSAWSGVSGYHAGRVFVISSGVERKSPLKKVAR